jgi:superkiller protein 3
MDWKNDYALFLSGIKTSPNSFRTHEKLANIYMDTAQSTNDSAKKSHFYSLAVHELKRSNEIFSMEADVYYNLGVCYYVKGAQDSAIYEYKAVIELDPKYALALNNLGSIYFNKGQYEIALPYLIKAYNADSSQLNAIQNIVAAYKMEKKYALAFHYDSLALGKEPGNKQWILNLYILHNDMGIQYLNTNELDKAIGEFKIVMKCDTFFAIANHNMGITYQNKGNIEMAKNYFQKALTKDPKNEMFARDLKAVNGGHL